MFLCDWSEIVHGIYKDNVRFVWHCTEMSKILPNGTVNMGLCVFFGMCEVFPNVEIKKILEN